MKRLFYHLNSVNLIRRRQFGLKSHYRNMRFNVHAHNEPPQVEKSDDDE